MAEQTVFVVDDDSAMRDSLQWLLQSEGLAVETHATAEGFLRAYDSHRPGCLVLDMRLPGMSGLELRAELTARGTQLPTIIISGYGDGSTRARALKVGAFEFIEKPFSDEALLGHIHRALEADLQVRGINRRL